MPPRPTLIPTHRNAGIAWSPLLATWLLLALFCLPAPPANAAGADWAPLVKRLSADGFPQPEIETLFTHPGVLFHPDAMTGKLKELLKAREETGNHSLTAILRSAIRRGYLSRLAISRARTFTQENKRLLEEAATRYQVPKEIIVSILLVETHLGDHTGDHCVFNRLASMAASRDLEFIRPHLPSTLVTQENEVFLRRRCQEKADWAYEELKALLAYAHREGLDPLGLRGSMYGAIGLCQFMPSNLAAFGVDADGDGRIDPFSKPDALHSIANYLKGHGWRNDLNREGQHKVIFAYNHSIVYANTVLAIAERMKGNAKKP